VRVIDQHEDSIYSVAWSPADAWMYCSLSFDGTYVQKVLTAMGTFTSYFTDSLDAWLNIYSISCVSFFNALIRI
jgi:hypothetical protein